jgi:hypothetical protein
LDEHVKTSIQEHLRNLELHFELYFPSFDEAEQGLKLCILNPFHDNALEQAGILEEIMEQIFELLLLVY